MRYQASLTFVAFFLLLATTSQAQLRGGAVGSGMSNGNVHIHVVLDNDRSAGPYLLVRLMNGSTSEAIGTTYTNDIGEADFPGVPVGDYHVQVSGDGIETTESDTFEVDNRKVTQAEYVTVHKVDDSGPKPLSSHSATVSATDLNVPQKARKELDKANEAMAMHDWKKALEHLNKAVVIAPQYATAYNNLAVLYAKTGDSAHEEEALKKSIAIDPHFAPALINYGKLYLREKNCPGAEQMLGNAAAAEPNNPDTLMLLAYAQYLDHHLDAAIASALHAHSSEAEHPSFVHYIAGRAYQQENQPQQALAQFQQFLKEEPKGPRADHVRGDVTRLQAATQQAAAH